MSDNNAEYENLSYGELLDRFKEEIKNFELVRKKDIIKILAKKLEEIGTPRDMICEKVTEDLKGVINSERYIRDCLPEEYKRKKLLSNTAEKAVYEDKKPIELSITSEGRTDSPVENHTDWEQEKERIYESNHKPIAKDLQPPILIDKQELESLRLENGKLKESLKEQKERFAELVKSTNLLAAQKKNVSVIESIEYQALKSQLLIAEEERDEYKQVATKNIKANPSETFQSAAEIKQESPSPQQAGTNEVEFPAKELSTFWLDAKNAKQIMYFKIADGKVIGWESDYARAKNQGRKAA